MFGRICPAVSCLYIALLVQVPFGSPLRGGIEGGAPNLKILSPPLYSFVSLSGKQIDGNVGTEIKIKYLIKNFLVPTEGVICITPDSLDHSSSSSIFVDDEQVAKSGIVRLSNVQAGTHMIRFDMLAHVITNKGKTGYQSLGHAFAIFEVIPSAVPRFYPPVPRLSLPISPGEECTGANFIQQEIRENDQMSNWFRSLPSSIARLFFPSADPVIGGLVMFGCLLVVGSIYLAVIWLTARNHVVSLEHTPAGDDRDWLLLVGLYFSLLPLLNIAHRHTFLFLAPVYAVGVLLASKLSTFKKRASFVFVGALAYIWVSQSLLSAAARLGGVDLPTVFLEESLPTLLLAMLFLVAAWSERKVDPEAKTVDVGFRLPWSTTELE